MKKIKYFFTYLMYRIFNFLFLALPKPIIKEILLFLANLAFILGKKRKKIAKANLDLVFRDTKSDEEKYNIIKNSYITLLFNMYEFMENQYISKEEILKKACIKNEHIVKEAIKNKRKIIYTTAHFGGWELALPYVAAKYGVTAVVGKDIKNYYIQKNYKSLREKNNILFFSKNSSAKKMINALKDGIPLIIAMDQHTKNGVEMEFLGKKDMVIDSASRLALRFDALIIPAFSIMNDFRNYTIEMCDPIDVKKMNFSEEDSLQDKIYKLTKKQVQAIEEKITTYPNQWLWQHKRWRIYHGNIYK